MNTIEDVLSTTFRIPTNEGVSKICSLQEAVTQFVKPNYNICIGSTHNYPIAAIYELIRVFSPKMAKFSIITAGMLTPSILLVFANLVEKVTADLFGDVFFTPGPNPVIQEAIKEQKIEFEHWSVLTHPLQLMAGAMGVGFMPTNSLIGSSMEETNVNSFRVIRDPFDTQRQIGLVKALNPDICFMHGLAADSAGNTIFVPPYGEDVYGAYASKNGVIITVEKIVSTEFIRKFSHFVKIPSYIVKSVCEVPLGAHPWGFGNLQIPELAAYADDGEFQNELRQAFKKSQSTKRWIDKWVLGCKSHDEYLKQLTSKRILTLKGKAHRESFNHEVASAIDEKIEEPHYNPIEMAIIAAARTIKTRIINKDYKTMLAGLGMGGLAAWLAYYLLKDEGYTDIDLMVEMGLYGYVPRPGDPFPFNHSNYPSCKMLTSKIFTLGILATGYSQRCIGLLGAGQVDKYGNINSTLMPQNEFITGSGGANDIASGASEIIVVMRQSKKRLVDKVNYITCLGKLVKYVVTDFGIFRKNAKTNQLFLAGCFSGNGNLDLNKCIENVQENCGWDIQKFSKIDFVEKPKIRELVILRLLDPKRYWLGKSYK